MIDPITVARIKGAADIVEVVSDYVHLVRRGANYMGLCPFHNERTPSFSVNKQRNFCYCFSCKKGGSPVNFIMEKEGLSYQEALMHLARKYGIEVVERELTDEEKERRSERESMLVANEWAMRQMESDMTDTEEGRDVGLQYFMQRGVTDAAIKAFHLGYSIDKGNHLTEKARHAGFELNVFKKLGLIGTSQKGHDYDRFRGRVIFPILNASGKVIAFGGRDLKGGLAKYINSPESELYKKSNEIYGIFQAKSAIVKDNKCYLVEGYMDVIGMWESGMKNVVASSGTALTDGQIVMIHRFTDNITLIYDGDAAGIKASLRGIDMLLSHRMNVKVLLLPDGEDPDSFARKHGGEEFRKYVSKHETDVIRFKAEVLLGNSSGDPHKRIEAVNSVITSIAHIPDQVARDVYVQECSTILNIEEATIAHAVGKARRALVESMKREKWRKEYPAVPTESLHNNVSTATQTPPVSTTAPRAIGQASSGDTASPPYSGQDSPIQQNNQNASGKPSVKSPFTTLEKEVLKYCVRYAYLQFCTYENETGEEVELDVLGFVNEELQDANMKFSNPLFAKTMLLLEEMREPFELHYANRSREIEAEIETERKKGHSEIANKDLSVAEIEKAERKLESCLSERLNEKLCEVIKDYPARELGSHEDENIRRLSLELSFERHQLSNIYQREATYEKEEDRLQTLVVRALDEWKNELINQRMSALFEEFRKISGTGNVERERELQEQLSDLMRVRTEMAKAIGERILFNRPVGKLQLRQNINFSTLSKNSE